MNTYVQSIRQHMFLDLLKHAGSVVAVRSLVRKGFDGSSYFSMKIIHVLKMRDNDDADTPNRTAGLARNKPTCRKNNKNT